MAIADHRQKLEKKPIKIEGISHTKFVGLENLTEVRNAQNPRRFSFDSKLKRERLRNNHSFVQKIKH